jgi:hypothetical protein
MPRGDRTGPMGMGPMSGRGAGYCANYQMPGFMNRFSGRGSGAGFRWNLGGGRGGVGWRNMFRNIGNRWSNQDQAGFGRRSRRMGRMPLAGGVPAGTEPDTKTEKQALEDQVDFLKSQLDRLQQRLSELESTRPPA